MDISKVLIANRGECAIRIQNTLRSMGMKSVIIFSDADRGSEHVRLADEAYRVGAGPSAESYLRQDLIIEIAHNANCIAIHPGYGFLAENSEFAKKVIDAGLIWIGPNPDLIDLFGDKVAARRIMQKFEIPLLPGTVDPVEDTDEITDLVSEIGFPIIIKAAGGGGGKGMRIVSSEDELASSLEICKSEAQRSFGKSTVFIEKYVEKGHHIEFQILGDKHGQAWHFGHRECSVQRRHQKVIEESPSLVVKNEEANELLAKLVNVCKELEYDSLGTFEFLQTTDGQYFFLEMNTRLQVEHSVTEMTWDVDLVKLQIEAAFGHKLQIEAKQSEGAAIECRIYAEDPLRNFAPSPGIIDTVKFASDHNVRVDSYLRDGLEIPLFYDPMIAKLTVWGKNRNAARLKMIEVLTNSCLSGI
ncbi:MAG: biotin carboxylase N-terminal domain-containing protein, partial [bacterium]|nr:biotin carboxylase N-terminal domain-containing protein [bacterium]